MVEFCTACLQTRQIEKPTEETFDIIALGVRMEKEPEQTALLNIEIQTVVGVRGRWTDTFLTITTHNMQKERSGNAIARLRRIQNVYSQCEPDNLARPET